MIRRLCVSIFLDSSHLELGNKSGKLLPTVHRQQEERQDYDTLSSLKITDFEKS